MAGIHEFVYNPLRDTGKEQTLEAPIRKIDQVLRSRGFMGQYIPKIIFLHQVRLDLAKLAGEQPVSFIQRCRGSALGALIVNK